MCAWVRLSTVLLMEAEEGVRAGSIGSYKLPDMGARS